MKKIELPDFDDMIKLASKIGNEKTQILLSEASLQMMLAMITQRVTTNPDYYLGGKIPSNAHIASTYHILGENDAQREELINLRVKIAKLTGELKEDEALFKIYQEMINVWRTQSANERGAYLDS
jgi:hypothetical protein